MTEKVQGKAVSFQVQRSDYLKKINEKKVERVKRVKRRVRETFRCTLRRLTNIRSRYSARFVRYAQLL